MRCCCSLCVVVCRVLLRLLGDRRCLSVVVGCWVPCVVVLVFVVVCYSLLRCCVANCCLLAVVRCVLRLFVWRSLLFVVCRLLVSFWLCAIVCSCLLIAVDRSAPLPFAVCCRHVVC